MSRRTKLIGVILILVAIASFSAWPLWKKLYPTPVSTSLFEQTKALVDKDPQLKPAWDAAMQDGVLTWSEANEIWEKAGKKMEPEK
jgi:hypothetical protein